MWKSGKLNISENLKAHPKRRNERVVLGQWTARSETVQSGLTGDASPADRQGLEGTWAKVATQRPGASSYGPGAQSLLSWTRGPEPSLVDQRPRASSHEPEAQRLLSRTTAPQPPLMNDVIFSKANMLTNFRCPCSVVCQNNNNVFID